MPGAGKACGGEGNQLQLTAWLRFGEVIGLMLNPSSRMPGKRRCILGPWVP